MPIYLKDIARMANVSTATVSRVINDKALGNMKEETCAKVKRIIEETGYTPHALASGLRTGMTKVIGVIFPSNVNPYYAQLGKAIEDESYHNGYLTLVCNSNYEVGREKDYVRHLTSQRVSGILLCSTGLKGGEIRDMVPKNIKVILLDEELPDFDGEIVIGDDFAGGYTGARYLHGLGHEKILVVTGPEMLSSSQTRLKGFLKFFEEKEISFYEGRLIQSDYTLESAYGCVLGAIDRGVRFSAVFTFNDLMAIGTIKALNERSYKVPEDVSVLGYDNIFIDDLVRPGITTVATPLEELGKLAARKLFQPVGVTRQGRSKTLLEPKLILRGSCMQCGHSK